MLPLWWSPEKMDLCTEPLDATLFFRDSFLVPLEFFGVYENILQKQCNPSLNSDAHPCGTHENSIDFAASYFAYYTPYSLVLDFRDH